MIITISNHEKHFRLRFAFFFCAHMKGLIEKWKDNQNFFLFIFYQFRNLIIQLIELRVEAAVKFRKAKTLF